MAGKNHRHWFVIRGDEGATLKEAQDLVAVWPNAAILWVGGDGAVESLADLRRQLGAAYDVVVVSCHRRFDADVLALCQGFVWGGGALVLRLPVAEPPPNPELVVWPYTTHDVGQRLWQRVVAALDAGRSTALPPAAPSQTVAGTAEQAAVVRRLAATLRDGGPPALLIADRGRGKSAALGMAIAASGFEVAVTSRSPVACTELLRFAGTRAHWCPPAEIPLGTRAIVVDEAAQLPIPVLRQLCRSHPHGSLIFSTTVHGYEGTGRGFELRFGPWLRSQRPEVETHHLHEPIRWGASDPLEQTLFAALLLDAVPRPPAPQGGIRYREIDRDRLGENDLRQIFALLVQAHYRTTPGDLHRLLDAPNLSVHVLDRGGTIVAVSLVAREGGLTAKHIEQLATGRSRIRGHALADTLACHTDHPAAAGLSMARSVRIAVHPDARRQGLASALISHIHRGLNVDVFGTLFGATAELLRFRRANDYHLVRLGAARGARTGVPTAVMMHPASEAGGALVAALRADLARDLPTQLDYLGHDPQLRLEPELHRHILHDLPPASVMSNATRVRIANAYAFGPRPFEAACGAIDATVAASAGMPIGPLLAHRVAERVPWVELARDQTVPGCMRRVRREMQELLRHRGEAS